MTTSNDYREQIQLALEFIDQHLGDKFSAADVAHAASFSEYHFHRLFPAFMGESIHQYVRTRRLEKAAVLLTKKPNSRLLDVALEVGFETHSAFSRAFKQQFGMSPTQFKKSPVKLKRLQFTHPAVTASANAINLAPTIYTLPQLLFACSVGKGTTAGQFFANKQPDTEFLTLIKRSGEELMGVASAFPASPQSLNDQDVEVWYGGLFTSLSKEQEYGRIFQIEAGKWAVFEYAGAYDYLHQVWNQIYRAWLPNSIHDLRDTLPFEMYLNNPQKVIPAKLLTQIWIPVE